MGTCFTSIRFHDTVSSTNDRIKELLSQNQDGVVVVAEEQTKGRGRKGRVWYSPPGVNLTFSFAIKIKRELVSFLPFVSGMALREVLVHLEPSLASQVTIKWPNDVYVGDKKISGTLMESSEIESGIMQAIVGIGINVNQRQEDMDPEIKDKATSLREVLERKLDRKALLSSYLSEFSNALELLKGPEGVSQLLNYVNRHHYLSHKKVRVELTQNQMIEGVVEGLNNDGALLVRTPSGIIPIISGDVELV